MFKRLDGVGDLETDWKTELMTEGAAVSPLINSKKDYVVYYHEPSLKDVASRNKGYKLYAA